MNWSFKFAKQNKWSHGFEKTADDDKTDFETPYYKDEFQFEIADVDRYATDKYFANLTLLETHNLYSIGFQMYNYQVGVTGAVQYWHYEKNEFDRAKKTFNEIKSALTETMSDIEYNRPPMAVITPMIRTALQDIDVGRKERSGNYFHNWFEEVSKEPDWRTTIYGNRYPSATIQYIDAFWNTDEASKEIVSEGGSRSRILRYKQASIQKEADLRQTVTKWINYAKGFGVGVTIGWIGANYTILEQKAAENPQFSAKQVFDSVIAENPETLQNPISETESAVAQPEIAENPVKTPESVDSAPETARISRGIRNNNPGNLERNETNWQGMAEAQDDERFITFSSPEYGIRAMARVLKNYDRRHGLRTIEQIIGRWAPASENQTGSYIHQVAQELGISPTSPLNLNDDDVLGRLIRSIINHENGTIPYDDDTIARGVALEKLGGTTRVVRHAFQETVWAKLKYYVRKLAREGYTEQQVGKALADEGVSSYYISRLIAEVFVPYMSGAYAENIWSYKFGCKTG